MPAGDLHNAVGTALVNDLVGGYYPGTSSFSVEVSATPSGGPTLVAHYAFDGDARDSSGNANDACTTGSPTFVDGQYGSAMDFNGANQYAMAPATIMASVTDFTIAAWVKWGGGGSAWPRIFDFGNDTTQNMLLTPSSGSGTLRFAMTTGGTAGEQRLETTALTPGTWTHVAITRYGNTAQL